MSHNFPENGGALKPAMRFEYEFSSPKKQQTFQASNLQMKMVNSARDQPTFKAMTRKGAKKDADFFNANVFSCMDAT